MIKIIMELTIIYINIYLLITRIEINTPIRVIILDSIPDISKNNEVILLQSPLILSSNIPEPFLSIICISKFNVALAKSD